jgi:hypothetical protein
MSGARVCLGQRSRRHSAHCSSARSPWPGSRVRSRLLRIRRSSLSALAVLARPCAPPTRPASLHAALVRGSADALNLRNTHERSNINSDAGNYERQDKWANPLCPSSQRSHV